MNERNSPWIGLAVGAVIGVVVGLGGFYLTELLPSTGMGLTMFFLVPYCAGFAIALVTRNKVTASASMLLAALASLAILIAIGREGVLCAILAFPLLAVGIGLGAFSGYFFRRQVMDPRRNPRGMTLLALVLAPAAILGGQHAEKQRLDATRREVVSDSIWVQASPEEIWPRIQSLDQINAAKPFLMHIGLPVPVRCEMSATGVGAKRTCFFEHGYIEETVVEWQAPYTMRLSIDRTNMPGRHWLGFEMAEYHLQPSNGGTLLTRTTTITSHLYPVWYWRYFERLGVASEHRYLLSDLQNRWKQ